MHVGDTIFIFCLALIIFGPKKLPEIGRQIGKLMVEFRRASNEFKMQIDEELRAAEQSERQKEITAASTMLPTAASSSPTAALAAAVASNQANVATAPVISPPSTGLPVNHTFTADAQEESPAAPANFPDAYPEAANGFNAALNTASNGAIAETPASVAASFPTETFPPSTVAAAEIDIELPEPETEKAQAPVHHG
jgi:sec-independent protein translocase protein TatB